MATARLVRRCGAVLIAAGLAVGACSGDDDGESGSGSSSDPAPPGSDSEFCTDAVAARDTVRSIEETLDADMTTAASAYGTAHQTLVAVEPPDELAEDWATVTELIGQVATALQGVDINDRAAVGAALSQALGTDGAARAEAASDRIDDYLRESCGIDLDQE